MILNNHPNQSDNPVITLIYLYFYRGPANHFIQPQGDLISPSEGSENMTELLSRLITACCHCIPSQRPSNL